MLLLIPTRTYRTHDFMEAARRLAVDVVVASPHRPALAALMDGRHLVMPYIAGWGFRTPAGGQPLPEGFAYRSDTNDLWLSIEDLRRMIADLGG